MTADLRREEIARIAAVLRKVTKSGIWLDPSLAEPFAGWLHDRGIRSQDTATARIADYPTVNELANALHAVDDDVQFIRPDARNLPVLAARLLAVLSGETRTDGETQ